MSKYVHYSIQRNGNTITLYQDGEEVDGIDFWHLETRPDYKPPDPELNVPKKSKMSLEDVV
jgi:hypothetical protein